MTRLDAPGIYDIPLAEYLADPCPAPSFSASAGKTAIQLSPLHAWLKHPRLGGNAEPPSAKADFGSVVHELVLGNGAQCLIIDPADHPNKDGSAPQKENSAMKKAKAEAIKAGLIPISPDDFKRAQKAAEAIRHELAPVFAEGAAEQTMIWKDEDIWCRARPDWMVGHIIFDLKITGVNMSQLDNTLHRHLFQNWYDLSVAHYADGYRSLFGDEVEYRFLFVENHPPFSIRQLQITGMGVEMGERKLRAARALWKRCVAHDEWPGMQISLEMATPEPWAAAGWLTYDSEPSDYERELAREMQAPLEDA